MTVHLPLDMPQETSALLKSEEKQLAQRLQRDGTWRHLWRIAGQYANVSVFDVESIDELHDTLILLPLFPYMKIEVLAMCRHPSSVHDSDK